MSEFWKLRAALREIQTSIDRLQSDIAQAKCVPQRFVDTLEDLNNWVQSMIDRL